MKMNLPFSLSQPLPSQPKIKMEHPPSHTTQVTQVSNFKHQSNKNNHLRGSVNIQCSGICLVIRKHLDEHCDKELPKTIHKHEKKEDMELAMEKRLIIMNGLRVELNTKYKLFTNRYRPHENQEGVLWMRLDADGSEAPFTEVAISQSDLPLVEPFQWLAVRATKGDQLFAFTKDQAAASSWLHNHILGASQKLFTQVHKR